MMNVHRGLWNAAAVLSAIVLSACTVNAGGGDEGSGGSGNGGGGGTGGDTTAPVVSSVTPAQGATGIATNVALGITFSESMDCATVTATALTLKDAAEHAIAGTVTCSGSSASFTPAALGGSTTYTATVGTNVKDAAGNALASAFSWSFTTRDTTAPTLSLVVPASGAINVAVDSAVSMAFSEAMDCATVTSSTVVLSDGTLPVGAALTCNGSTVTLKPNSVFADGAKYFVAVTNGVKDLSGNPLITGYAWQFTTADHTAPTVVSVSPADTATNVALGTSLTVNFSEALNCATVNATTLSVQDIAGNLVDGAVTCNQNVATFTPEPSYADGVQLVATVSTGIRDSAGNALAANYTWSFRTRTRSWGAPVLLETDNAGDAGEASVAFDAAGNGLAVWEQSDGVRYNIWANRYTANAGWGIAEVIETDSGDAYSPRLVMDSDGNALAVWSQSNGSRSVIRANRYNAGIGWSTATQVEANTGDAIGPRLAMDASGNAVAVWFQTSGAIHNIYASRYVMGVGWGSPTLLESGTGDAVGPDVAVDQNGNALAVWHQAAGTRWDIWYNRFTSGGSWGSASLVESDTTNSAAPIFTAVRIAMNANGEALAAWTAGTSTGDVWANRYAAGMWSTPVRIDNDSVNNALNPSVAVDADGNGIVAWAQYDGTRFNIMANRYTAGSGWGSATLLETSNLGNAMYPQLAIGAGGSAVAVWQQSDGTRDNIWFNRYKPGTGWASAPSLVEAINTGSARNPQIAFDRDGNGVVIWGQSDGTRYNQTTSRYE